MARQFAEVDAVRQMSVLNMPGGLIRIVPRMAAKLSDVPLQELRRMLIATERAVGADSVSARLIQRAIARKRPNIERRPQCLIRKILGRKKGK